MTGIEARKFLDDEIIPRWPQWNINEMEIGDWVRVLCRYEWERCKRAIRDYAENKTKFENKTPSISKFKGYMANTSSGCEKKKTEWLDCNTFIQNADTGRFIDVVLNPPSNDPFLLSKAARNMQIRLGEVYTGVWRIFKETTRWKMRELQREIRRDSESDIEATLDTFCKPVPTDINEVPF